MINFNDFVRLPLFRAVFYGILTRLGMVSVEDKAVACASRHAAIVTGPVAFVWVLL
jgi:hypothetical protein